MCNDKSNQYENIEDWPVSPTFLAKRIVSKNENYSLNKHGIYTCDTLRGLLADASDDPNIQNPLSLFQVVPKSYNFEKFLYLDTIAPSKNDAFLNDILKGKRVIRIDPNFLYKNKTCCDSFRSCNGYEKKCHEQDCRIALLYHDELKAINYSEDFEMYFSKLIKIIEKYNETHATEYPLFCVRDNNRLYVWYQCPYSNFYEYYFPIIHSGKVIAVLMQGQRIPFSLNREDVFHNILKSPNLNISKRQQLEHSIALISKDEFGKDPMNKERLNAIWSRISTFEDRINEEVKTYSRAFIYNVFNRIEDDFHNRIKLEIKNNRELSDEKYKEIVNNALGQICRIFNKNGFIRIFSTETKFEENHHTIDTFFLIGTSDHHTLYSLNEEWSKIVFNKLPSDIDKLESMRNDDFYPHLKRQIKFSDYDDFHIEGLSIGDTKHLIWTYHPLMSNIGISQMEEYSNFLGKFFHTIWESYNLLRSVKLRKKLETSIRVSCHETSQIIPVVVNTLKKEYNIDSITLVQEDKLDRFGINKRTRTLYDTIQRLLLLDNLYKRSSLMFKTLTPLLVWVDLLPLVYSVKNLCDENAKVNNMQKLNILYDDEKIRWYKLFTDNQLISHTLFNLVDNAIKYGYMGSLINISITLEESNTYFEKNYDVSESINSLKIAIVSYGAKVKEEDERRLFELFYRSKESSYKDGMGIGLFLVKKICNSLGYSIEYNGSKLSDYNLPIYYYGKSSQKKLSLKTVSQSLIEQVVNPDITDEDWRVEDFEFDNAINQPTYRNEFVITLNKIDGNLLKKI